MSESESYEDDSDKELQAAFSMGLLKDGLNYVAPPPKTFINNIDGLKMALDDLRNNLPWIERLDVCVDPVSADDTIQLLKDANASEKAEVHNDFKREMNFYRLAQAAVFEAVPKLNKLGLITKRPEDYFAEMAKSDKHMVKVREKLISKKSEIERRDKLRKLRDLKKYGKKVQQEVLLERQKQKKDMMSQIKKYRKGKTDKLDFLDETATTNKKNPQGNKNREFKNKRFGFGGQKKRSKWNTESSAKESSGFNPKIHGGKKKNDNKPGKGNFKSKSGNFNSGNSKQGKNQRPGKANRQKNKRGKS